MLVVADSSPLILLIRIARLDVLPALFDRVVIPPEVSAELRQPNRPVDVRKFATSFPPWLIEQRPAEVEPIPYLHAGEASAISLARELKADLLLIDEIRGRRAAAERYVPYTGTIGVLELAADRDLLDLTETFAKVKDTDFWIAPDLLEQRLRLYRERRRSS